MAERERGQATVEFVLAVPVLAFTLALCVQVVGVLLDDLALTQWSREVAREASLADSGVEVGRPPHPNRLEGKESWVDVRVERVTGGEMVVTTATCHESIDLPLTGFVLYERTLRASSIMWVERSE